MKTSAVLASILFGSYAVAAPFDRRALVYKTEVVTETVVVYTTVWDDEPVATSTTSAGEFYEQPSTTSTAVVVSTSSEVATPLAAPTKAAPTSSEAAPAYTPVVPEEPSSVYTPVPTTTPAPAPAPETSSAAPEPTTTAVASPAPEPVYSQAPAPAASSAAPSPPTTGGSSDGAAYSDVEITIYDNTGAAGACGKALYDSSKVVAISIGAWNEMGGTTHDYMTGESTNPWCGKNIEIEYQGKTATAQIMDMCPGCVNKYDIDLSHAVWEELGLTEITRYHGVNWKVI
jgi:hypothetical protein